MKLDAAAHINKRTKNYTSLPLKKESIFSYSYLKVKLQDQILKLLKEIISPAETPYMFWRQSLEFMVKKKRKKRKKEQPLQNISTNLDPNRSNIFQGVECIHLQVKTGPNN